MRPCICQLTLIEAVVPLISGSPTTAFSPWKLEERPIQGVLHGLYVFGVIFQALGSLGQSVPEVEAYSAARLHQIAPRSTRCGTYARA